MAINDVQPYVGPRPFERKAEDTARFFGRSQETQEIASLIFGHPVTLVYAQSGAGKTSLFNTSITLELESQRFDVLPLTRVGGVIPKEFRLEKIDNLYIFNALLKMDAEADPRTLMSDSLIRFLERRFRPTNKRGQPCPRAIIFDQFEELFAYTPEHWREQRDGFFQQVVEALNADPLLRVVFVIREDFLAELDPYASRLPEQLRIRYRLERLGENAALRAIKDPLNNTSRRFAPDVAEDLVRELLKMRTLAATGKMTQIVGQYVEPVQLQVVCVTLWDSLEADVTEIQKSHLKNFNVNDALSNFYKSTVESAARETGVPEMDLREWFGKKLITPVGTRSTVFRGEESTSGIANNAVEFLEGRHIIRAEFRAGARWYELTHDRLVEPIINNNQKWLETLSPLQRQAILWNDHDRNESWLLRDKALAEVQNWAKENPNQLTHLENDFLAACHKYQQDQEEAALRQKAAQDREIQRQRLEAARRSRNIAIGFLIAALLLGVVAVFQGVQARSAEADAVTQRNIASTQAADADAQRAIAVTQKAEADAAKLAAQENENRATIQRNKALAGNLAAQADSLKNTDYRLALLLGVEAYQRDTNSLLARSTLFQLLQFTPYQRSYNFLGPVTSVVISPEGSLIATSSCGEINQSSKVCTRGGIQLLDAASFDAEPVELADLHRFGLVYSLAFHYYAEADRLVLAAAGCVPTRQSCADKQGQITLWDVTNPTTPQLLYDTFTDSQTKDEIRHEGLVKTIAFSHDGIRLASGSYDQKILLWTISNDGGIIQPVPSRDQLTGTGHRSFVNSLTFSLNDQKLVSAGDDKVILVWDLARPGSSPIWYKNHDAPVTAVAFSPDGTNLASASDDTRILLWDWKLGQLGKGPIALLGHTGYIKSLAFNSDGSRLASSGFDNSVILWDTSTYHQIGPALDGHSAAVNSIAFVSSPDLPSYLVSVSDDRTAVKWDLSARNPVNETFKPVSSTGTPAQSQMGDRIPRIDGQQIDIVDSSSGELYLVIAGFKSRVVDAKFEASNLITVEQYQESRDWTTKWIVDPDIWVSYACEAVQRNLSAAEVEKYLQGNNSIYDCPVDLSLQP